MCACNCIIDTANEEEVPTKTNRSEDMRTELSESYFGVLRTYLLFSFPSFRLPGGLERYLDG